MNELWDRLMFAQSQAEPSAEQQQRVMQGLASQTQPNPSPASPPEPRMPTLEEMQRVNDVYGRWLNNVTRQRR
jgi:hypothetical protein